MQSDMVEAVENGGVAFGCKDRDIAQENDRIIRNLVSIATASQRADGTDIPLGQQVREAAHCIITLGDDLTRARAAIAAHDTALTAEVERLKAQCEALAGALAPFSRVAARDIGIDEADNDLFRTAGTKYNQAPPLNVGHFRDVEVVLAAYAASKDKP